MAQTDREKALDQALAQIEKQFGRGAIMRLGEESRTPIEVIPTGAIALDVALGIGGLPRGRIVEIYGPEASGKTTCALHAIASVQKQGGIAAFIDAEHALDPAYAGNLGVDLDSLYVAQPDTGEQALEIADTLVRSGAMDLIVIDSVAALVPRAEIEGEMGDSHVGLQARLMSQALRKMAGALNNSNTTAIFINQLREKIGVSFGSPETTTGGRALKFYSSVRLDVRRIETLKGGTEAVGNRVRVKVVKNKCLAEGTMVFDPVAGVARDIAEIVDQRLTVHVAAVDSSGIFHARPVVAWFDQGEQEVIGLRLQGTGEIWLTPDHRILTDRGWQEAQDLAPGSLVAQPGVLDGLELGAALGSARMRTSGDQAALRSGALVAAGSGGGHAGASTAPPLAADAALGHVIFAGVTEVLSARRRRTFDVEVAEDHNLVANGIVVHNCAPPFKQAEFDVLYGEGISREGSLLDLGVDNGIVRKSGAWYTYESDQLGQGKENARAFLRDNPDLADEIEKRIKEQLGIIPRLDAPAEEATSTAGAPGDGQGNVSGGKARPLVPPTPIDL